MRCSTTSEFMYTMLHHYWCTKLQLCAVHSRVLYSYLEGKEWCMRPKGEFTSRTFLFLIFCIRASALWLLGFLLPLCSPTRTERPPVYLSAPGFGHPSGQDTNGWPVAPRPGLGTNKCSYPVCLGRGTQILGIVLLRSLILQSGSCLHSQS